MRGNVIDLAVGIIIGTAFTGIVNSLVNASSVIFVLVKNVNRQYRKASSAAPPTPSKCALPLKEIRDLLRKNAR
jgi:large-conductance mechanosensitive channel